MPQSINPILKLVVDALVNNSPAKIATGGSLNPMNNGGGAPTIFGQTPSVDLGQISVRKPAQVNSQQPVSAPSVSSSPVQAPPVPASVPQSAKSGGFNLGDILLRMGVPGIAAIAGSVNPNLLPQAAGLATGYQSSMEKIDEKKREDRPKKLKVYDEETGELIDTGKIIEATDEVMKKSKSKEDFSEKLLSELLGIDYPTAKTGDAVKNARMKVKNISTNQTGTIEASEFDPALYEKL